MVEESVRIEIAFLGGPVIAATVTGESADALERAVHASAAGVYVLDTDDGRLSVAVSGVAYVKRFAREARVGFGV